MHRIVACATVALALAAVPAALADGPFGYAVQSATGVLSLDGTQRYVAVGAGQTATTMLEAISTRDGSVVGSVNLIGDWGTPYVVSPNEGAGLSPDGRTLVLADVPVSFPQARSAFMFLDPRTLRMRDAVSLKGDYAFDALSPDGKRLYLIQHVDQNDQSRYVVRAFDVRTQALLPGRVADWTQKSWVMLGYPVSRVTSPGGRWVYTLYDNPGGFPFVHALDTVRGIAHCVGLPWFGSEGGVYNMRLALHDGGRTLAVGFASGRRWMLVDARTWRIAPDRGGLRRWPLAAGAGGLVVVLAGLALLLRRRLRQRRLDDELARVLAGEVREAAPVA
jgi:hypothetical protein